jgi:hypothetical protein
MVGSAPLTMTVELVIAQIKQLRPKWKDRLMTGAKTSGASWTQTTATPRLAK